MWVVVVLIPDDCLSIYFPYPMTFPNLIVSPALSEALQNHLSAGPKGGQKGHMPPRSDRESYLAPGKKMKNVKRHAKNWYKCESNTCPFTECKNGSTLVNYGNLRLLIRDWLNGNKVYRFTDISKGSQTIVGGPLNFIGPPVRIPADR